MTFIPVMLWVSATWNVTVVVPADVGVPEIMPVELFNDNPVGSVPDDQT